MRETAAAPTGPRSRAWSTSSSASRRCEAGAKLLPWRTPRSAPGRSGATALAVLVLLVGAWLLLGVIGHVLSFLFSTLLLVVAIVAVIWALRILL